MEKSIQEFKNIHLDKDIWVIATGASINYIDKSFFEGKITIGVNDVDCIIPTTYIIKKEFTPSIFPRSILEKYQINDTKLCLAEYNGCVEEWGKNIDKEDMVGLFDDFDIWTYKTPFTHGELLMPDSTKGEELPASLSCTAMAMWLAAFMGAKNIILCGNDECMLDSQDYAEGVPSFNGPSDHSYIISWQASQSLPVRDTLRKLGFNIYSLHPFINLSLEGHKVVVYNG